MMTNMGIFSPIFYDLLQITKLLSDVKTFIYNSTNVGSYDGGEGGGYSFFELYQSIHVNCLALTEKPGFFDMTGKAKWDAWDSKKGRRIWDTCKIDFQDGDSIIPSWCSCCWLQWLTRETKNQIPNPRWEKKTVGGTPIWKGWGCSSGIGCTNQIVLSNLRLPPWKYKRLQTTLRPSEAITLQYVVRLQNNWAPLDVGCK